MSLCQTYRLSNGLKVLAIPSPLAPVVALQGWIRFGAADEHEDVAGLAHLFEHLLFKGTERRRVGEISREIEGLGGNLNAYTSYDHTVMHMTLPSSHLEKGLDILADALQNSVVDEGELAREREVVLEEIRRRNDMPAAIATDLVRAGLYGRHPYSRPVIGFADVVANMSRDALMTEYRRHYNASNLFLVVAGDFETPDLIDHAERLLGGLQPGVVPEGRPQRPSSVAQTPAFRHNPSPDAILHLAWRGIAADNPDAAAMDALALIVGQGESSRLMRRLVNDDKLVRDISAACWTPKDVGYFGVVFRGPHGLSEKMPRVLEAVRDCIEAPFTERELDKARKNLLSTATYSKETVDGLAERFGSCESVCGDIALDDRYMNAVRVLSLEDLERVRRKYLAPDAVVMGGIFPEGDRLPEPGVLPPAPKRPSKLTLQGAVETFNYRGLKVILKPVDHLPIFSLRLAGLGGGRLESPSQTGIGNLWARTVADGGRAANGRLWTRDEISDHVDRSSASFSAFHGRNSWGFALDGLSDDFENLLEVFSASLLEPSFDKKIVEQARTHILQDIRSAEDNPGSVVSRIFTEAMFDGHAYGRSAEGDAKHIRKLTIRNLQTYHAKMLEQPAVLSVVGHIDRERLERALDAVLGDLKFRKSSPLTSRKKLKALAKDAHVWRRLKKEQTHLLLGYRTCTLFHADRWALLGLSAILSGQGGRLFLELRDRMSLCYSVAPTHMEGFDGGYFGFYIATAPDKTDTALSALRAQIERVCEGDLSDQEWRSAQRFYIGNHEIEKQRLSAQALGTALDELYGNGWREHFEFANRLGAVTAEDVVRVARKYLRGPSVTAIVGP